MISFILFFIGMLLAYANGANDNFKGFATLWGSRIITYRVALTWSTIATIAGAMLSVYFADTLVANFSGKGLVPEELVGTSAFVLSVGLAAGLTVLFATFLGFPISTTHAIVGGLIGAGLIGSPVAVNLSKLSGTFVLPLLFSPVLAAMFSFSLYFLLRETRKVMGIKPELCLCLENNQWIPVQVTPSGCVSVMENSTLHVGTSAADCQRRYMKTIFSIPLQVIIDKLHLVSAISICAARSINDAPKLAALLTTVHMVNANLSVLAIACGMAVGGIMNARKVAETMSKKLAVIQPIQGFSANLVTSFLVIFASNFGFPVSTTHVSVGTIFGVSSISGKANFSEFTKVIMSWIVTLPMAAAISAFTMLAFKLTGYI